MLSKIFCYACNTNMFPFFVAVRWSGRGSTVNTKSVTVSPCPVRIMVTVLIVQADTTVYHVRTVSSSLTIAQEICSTCEYKE